MKNKILCLFIAILFGLCGASWADDLPSGSTDGTTSGGTDTNTTGDIAGSSPDANVPGRRVTLTTYFPAPFQEYETLGANVLKVYNRIVGVSNSATGPQYGTPLNVQGAISIGNQAPSGSLAVDTPPVSTLDLYGNGDMGMTGTPYLHFDETPGARNATFLQPLIASLPFHAQDEATFDAPVTINGNLVVTGGDADHHNTIPSLIVSSQLDAPGQVDLGSQSPKTKTVIWGDLEVKGKVIIDEDLTVDKIKNTSPATATTFSRVQVLNDLVVNDFIKVNNFRSNTGGTQAGDVQYIFSDRNGTRNLAIIQRNAGVLGGGVGLSIAGNLAEHGTSDTIDLAEHMTVKEKGVGPGDIVSVCPDADARVELSHAPNELGLVGIVATKPGYVLGKDLPGLPIALAGVVPCKVSLNNGPIAPGDLITSSPLPGVGMRSTGGGYVVGKALEPFDGRKGDVGKILVFVNVGYYDVVQRRDLEGRVKRNEELLEMLQKEIAQLKS